MFFSEIAFDQKHLWGWLLVIVLVCTLFEEKSGLSQIKQSVFFGKSKYHHQWKVAALFSKKTWMFPKRYKFVLNQGFWGVHISDFLDCLDKVKGPLVMMSGKIRMTKNLSKKAQNDSNLPKIRLSAINMSSLDFAGTAYKSNYLNHQDFAVVPCVEIFQL